MTHECLQLAFCRAQVPVLERQRLSPGAGHAGHGLHLPLPEPQRVAVRGAAVSVCGAVCSFVTTVRTAPPSAPPCLVCKLNPMFGALALLHVSHSLMSKYGPTYLYVFDHVLSFAPEVWWPATACFTEGWFLL